VTPDPPREVLAWGDVGVATRELAQRIADDGFEPEAVIAIARGGLLVAGALADALGVKRCGPIDVELDTGVDPTLPEPPRLAVEILTTMGAEVRSACLSAKPQTVFAPDWTWKETDRWIVFPWSAESPVVGTAGR
jgi:hypoxanthine phosphoribosyltransferase